MVLFTWHLRTFAAVKLVRDIQSSVDYTLRRPSVAEDISDLSHPCIFIILRALLNETSGNRYVCPFFI